MSRAAAGGTSGAGSARVRNLRTIGALAVLFLVPLVLAFYTYYATGWRPAGRVNHGVLISPPRPLPPLSLPRLPPRRTGEDARGAGGAAFRGTWTLVYVGAGDCDPDCRQALYLMRQTRLALNSEMTRVARVFLATTECCADEGPAQSDPGLVVLDATAGDGAALLQAFPTPARQHSVFVVDPLGNLMMSYDARANPRGLLEDLHKLLRLSHIG